MPRCRFCSDLYKPARPMQPSRVCNKFECQASFMSEHVTRQRQKRAKAERVADIADRRSAKEKLAKLRPGYLEGKAQDAINGYVRVRDHEYGCISCDKPASWDGQWHAGHLIPRGRSSFLRFDLRNINKQCSVCNHHEGGMVAEHERGIVARYGQERLDYLKSAPRSRKYDDDYLIRLAKVFRRKTRVLKKRKGLQ